MKSPLLRIACGILAASSVVVPAASRVGLVPPRVDLIANAITELDLERAEKLIGEAKTESLPLAYERARLSIYRGDCVSALATLSRPDLSESKEGAHLKELAESCARATAAGLVIEDRPRGLWLRLQDAADKPLAPFLFDVAARARDSVTRSVGVDLPRPLRIDLVRDSFSLSAVSGLPIAAAENTGTLAVARWGRVILLSPRAASLGFPWEDTLAHEITHLVVTRATRDRAPLWLQEGMAKRLESSWRGERPFDEPEWADTVAQRALREGRSIGIDRLGPSIAMLPTPEAASIAFAEVTSFVTYFARDAGEPALRLLLADLKGFGDHGPEAALQSVTGRSLSEWNERWQRTLAKMTLPGGEAGSQAAPGREVYRQVRLNDLLRERGKARSAADVISPSLTKEQREAGVRFRGARALLDAGEPAQANAALGALTEIGSTYGPWFALRGRLLRDAGDRTGAEEAFRTGIAVDPLAVDVACEGEAARRTDSGLPGGEPRLPEDPARRELCRAARDRP